MPAGTVGGRIAGTKKPCRNKASLASSASASAPTMKGKMGLCGVVIGVVPADVVTQSRCLRKSVGNICPQPRPPLERSSRRSRRQQPRQLAAADGGEDTRPPLDNNNRLRVLEQLRPPLSTTPSQGAHVDVDRVGHALLLCDTAAALAEDERGVSLVQTENGTISTFQRGESSAINHVTVH